MAIQIKLVIIAFDRVYHNSIGILHVARFEHILPCICQYNSVKNKKKIRLPTWNLFADKPGHFLLNKGFILLYDDPDKLDPSQS